MFHHLITLPTYHTAALSTDSLGAATTSATKACSPMFAMCSAGEIRDGHRLVKHQDMAGSNIGDDHKEFFSGETHSRRAAAHNTMNQFG